jgi:hypothetical protein
MRPQPGSRVKSILLTVFAAALLAAAQQPKSAPEPQLVSADVQVTETSTGKVIDVLGSGDFELFDNGVPREIRKFRVETAPLDIVFLLYGKEISLSPRERDDALSGLLTTARGLRPGDRAAVLRRHSAGRANLSMTSDYAAIRRALAPSRKRASLIGHGDRLFDAIDAAVSLLPRSRQDGRRRVILAVTDDQDRHSKLSLNRLITELLRGDITLTAAIVPLKPKTGPSLPIPAIPGLPWGGSNGGNDHRDSLWSAIQDTGGEALPGGELGQRIPELLGRIHSRYLLEFYANATPKRERHRLEVRLSAEARAKYPDALVRVRRGYFTRPR